MIFSLREIVLLLSSFVNGANLVALIIVGLLMNTPILSKIMNHKVFIKLYNKIVFSLIIFFILQLNNIFIMKKIDFYETLNLINIYPFFLVFFNIVLYILAIIKRQIFEHKIIAR